MEIKFCQRCGTELSKTGPNSFTCKNQHLIYVNPVPTVGIFFVNENNEIVMSVRAREPWKGGYDTFGGFFDLGDTSVETALDREIAEETGLTPDDYDQPQYFMSDTVVYPFGGEDLPLVTMLFWARLKPGAKLVPADDVSAVVALPLESSDLDNMATDNIRAEFAALQKILKAEG